MKISSPKTSLRPPAADAPAKAESTDPRSGVPGAQLATEPEAAALPGEVVENLGSGESAPDGSAAPHALRATVMTERTGAYTAEAFLSDDKTHTAGARMMGALAKGVDLTEGAVDFVVGGVGKGADAVADVAISGAESLEEVAGVVRGRFQGAAEELRERARSITAWADARVEDRKSEVTPGELDRARATGAALEAIADRLETLVELPTASEMLARGGSALFKVAAHGVELVGELVHAGAKGVAAAVSFAGKCLKKLLGSETLRATGLNVWGGIRLNLISKKLNFGGGASLFFPALNSDDGTKEGGEKKSYFDGLVADWGVSAATPAGGGGWSKKDGKGAGVNLFFLSASFNEKSESVFIGIPGVMGVTIGRHTERGSFTAFGGGIPLLGGPKLGLYANHGFAVHTPLLDPINKVITRPVAKVLSKVTEKIVGLFKKVKDVGLEKAAEGRELAGAEPAVSEG
jgi:hypothetical protein